MKNKKLNIKVHPGASRVSLCITSYVITLMNYWWSNMNNLLMRVDSGSISNVSALFSGFLIKEMSKMPRYSSRKRTPQVSGQWRKNNIKRIYIFLIFNVCYPNYMFVFQGLESDLRRPSTCTPAGLTSPPSCPASTASPVGHSPSLSLRKGWSVSMCERSWWRARMWTQQLWLYVTKTCTYKTQTQTKKSFYRQCCFII